MTLHQRLHAYAMVAVTPIAHADIIGETGLHVVVTPSAPVAIDFGPGFGEAIDFVLRDESFATQTSYHVNGCSYVTRSTHYVREARMKLRDNAPGHRLSAIADFGFWVDRLQPGFVVEGTPDHPNGWHNGTHHALADSYGGSSYRRFCSYGSTLTSHWTSDHAFGDWQGSTRGYLAVRFPDANEDRFHAWFDVETILGPEYTLVIHGWGMNTEPDGPIRTGQIPAPGGLALLAAGASGIRRARRD